MLFQVDSFDSAFMQITKIAGGGRRLCCGYGIGEIAEWEDERMTVTVRVPPDHLDTLTLKLRALGDLTGQKINAQDVT